MDRYLQDYLKGKVDCKEREKEETMDGHLNNILKH